jgi:hypothetical protein
LSVKKKERREKEKNRIDSKGLFISIFSSKEKVSVPFCNEEKSKK